VRQDWLPNFQVGVILRYAKHGFLSSFVKMARRPPFDRLAKVSHWEPLHAVSHATPFDFVPEIDYPITRM
jgi:hypothetical protein